MPKRELMDQEKQMTTTTDVSRKHALTDWTCTFILMFNWIYQGLFPKLLYKQPGDVALLRSTGLFPGHEEAVLSLIGIGEIVFGLLFWLPGRRARKFMHDLNIVSLILLACSAVTQPGAFVAPFNPITLNLAMIGLSVVGLLHLPEPSVATRTQKESEVDRHDEVGDPHN